MRKILSLIALTCVLGGCSKEQKTAIAATAPTIPPPTATAAQQVSGVIVETMNAAGYTYMLVRTASGDVWTAVRETAVTKGQTVTVEPQMVAEKFESTTLKRTFDRLILGTLAGGNAVAVAEPVAVPVVSGAVSKPSGGTTVAEVWEEKKQLAGKQVVIRGKVVKFNPQIMGKNWLHVQDGSGSREKANDDLTVTTTDAASVGEVVTITGTLRIDRDFGSGYLYPVIIEDARVLRDLP